MPTTKYNFTKILLPDGSAMDINKSYTKGKAVLPASATFLPFILNTFGETVEPTALGLGKTLSQSGKVKRTLEWSDENNEGKTGDKEVWVNAAKTRKTYPLDDISPLRQSEIILLPKADYEKVGYKNIVPQEVKEYQDGLRVLARKTLLKIMTTSASDYKNYKATAGEGTTALTTSTADTVDKLVKEITGNTHKYIVGDALDETKLYEKDALVKIINAVGEKFASKGVSIDPNHPSIIDGLNTDALLCITTRKVINEISNTDRITQIVNLPGNIEVSVNKVGGVQLVEDQMVGLELGGKARLIFIWKSSFAFVKDKIAGETYMGKVQPGDSRALTVATSSGTETINVMPNQSTITFMHTAYAGQTYKGGCFVVRVANPSGRKKRDTNNSGGKGKK